MFLSQNERGKEIQSRFNKQSGEKWLKGCFSELRILRRVKSSKLQNAFCGRTHGNDMLPYQKERLQVLEMHSWSNYQKKKERIWKVEKQKQKQKQKMKRKERIA